MSLGQHKIQKVIFYYIVLVAEKGLSRMLVLRSVYKGDFVAATQCNFCRAEDATSCDFIAILVQFVSANVSTRLFLKQKLCAC